MTNTDEYKLAERDVIEWLRTQPLDLSELNAKIATTLRAERLAQLGLLQRLAARGKLAAALAWIDDFLASGEPLVVFARHVEVQQAVVDRFGSGGPCTCWAPIPPTPARRRSTRSRLRAGRS